MLSYYTYTHNPLKTSLTVTISTYARSGGLILYQAYGNLYATTVARDKPNKRSGDADLSKDKSGPESPVEFRRSWYVKGRIRFGVISSVPKCAVSLRGQSDKGDEGLCTRGTKMNSIFITAKVTFIKAAHVNLLQHLASPVGPDIPIYPKEGGMVDSQPMEEEFQGATTRDAGTETHRGPTEPVLQTQKTPSHSPAFIKETLMY
ncbi:hypothetical protein Tco_0736106 [Tanacetum coccineum]